MRNIEDIIKEFKLSDEDIKEIDIMMHKQAKHLMISDNYEESYTREFESCAQKYLSRKQKGL
jgi:hypothetical protein